jgi:hypothetical protein
MSTPSPQDVTQLLLAWSQGEQTALEKLTPLIYEELHRLARHFMGRELPNHTLQTAALVHQDASHQLGRDGQEAGSVLPALAAAGNEESSEKVTSDKRLVAGECGFSFSHSPLITNHCIYDA